MTEDLGGFVFSVVAELDTDPYLMKQLLNLVERKIDLVYGGGSIGLMGTISKTVFQGGCHVLGVIPRPLLPIEIVGETHGEVKIVADMHQRKSEMEKHADAFIALPGGYGTMEELLEMITWSQLGIHGKPVGLLNVGGFFNSLLTLFDKGVEEGFIAKTERDIVILAESAEELLKKMEEYTPTHDTIASKQSWETENNCTMKESTSNLSFIYSYVHYRSRQQRCKSSVKK